MSRHASKFMSLRCDSYSRAQRPVQRITGHLGDDLPNQSIDWCKNMALQPITWLVTENQI